MSFSSELAAGIEDHDLKFVDSKPSPPNNTDDITAAQRMLSACSGSLVTSFVVTPFDVIRIRIQQQEILPSQLCCQVPEDVKMSVKEKLTPVQSSIKSVKLSKHPLPVAATSLASSTATSAVPVTAPELELFWINANYCKLAENCLKITSTFQGFVNITKNEGILTLWRGLSLTLFMSIPSNIIYFTGYEYIRDHSPVASHPLNPLFCGLFARIMAATFVAPIELVKTRLQSIPADAKSNKSTTSILSTLLRDSYSIVRQKGVGTLFTGLQITLWRDVPFSGIYWSCYELFKDKFGGYLNADFNSTSEKDDWRVFTTSFLAGSVSGFIGAFFTNPFDVGKTRLQITQQLKLNRPSMFAFLYNIYKTEGMAALYSGFVPRVMKVAPACAIMISSYEIGKKIFKNANNN